ncbi:MAG: LysR family transcriptional regulator [Deltaproteobacteria bacterium]|nr:LysR family transcriptional regulator [Deltaproteobacteria bacterium]
MLHRWDDLRVFLAVHREDSFSGAARVLGVKQSTVSRRIAALEEALGGVLFDRTARGPVLTSLGRALAERAPAVESAALACWDVVRAEQKAVAGRIRLATTESFAVHVLVPHVLPSLRERYPELDVDLVLGEHPADLTRREADIAVRFFRTRDGDLVEKRVAQLPTAILGRPERFGEVSEASELPFVTLELASGESVAEAYARKLTGREPVMRTTSHLAQIEAVRAGIGCALLTRSLVSFFPELAIWEGEAPKSPPVDLYLVAPRALRRVPSVAALWSELEATAKRLAATFA